MLKKMAMIGFGSTLMGIGVNVFILPYHLLNGGFIGVSLLLSYIWDFKVGLTMIFLSAPVYLLALKIEPMYFYNGIYGLLLSSFMIDLLYPLNGIIHLPIIISALFGGLFIGSGVGLMLRQNTCPGGIDLLSLLISKRISLNVGVIIFLFDVSIILTGLFILRDKNLIYSVLTVSGAGFATSLLTSFRSINFYLK